MNSLPHVVAVVPLALGAAGSFAVANVAQMRAARRAAGPSTVSPRLFASLVRDRMWLLGLAASFFGYALQAAALFLAPVIFVQPLIVTELLFALPLAAGLAGVRLGRREWVGAVLVAAGITCFVLVGNPTGERTNVGAGLWAVTTAAVVGAVAVLVIVAESRPHLPVLRASLLAAGASICFGFMSVLTKVVGHQFRTHKVGALELAQPWMLAVIAITGLLLAQTAFRIAPLSVSLPLIDVGEPLIASIVAVLILGETFAVSPGTVAGVIVSATSIAAGVAVLDTSPRVRAAQHEISAGFTPPAPARDTSLSHQCTH